VNEVTNFENHLLPNYNYFLLPISLGLCNALYTTTCVFLYGILCINAHGMGFQMKMTQLYTQFCSLL
jgi:hypothetical protein